MNKLILIASVLVFAYANSHAQSIPKWKLNDLKTAISKPEKPTIFNFWATFCVPCLQEIPYFQEITDRHTAQDVSLVFVSLDMKQAYPVKVNETAKKLKLVYPVVWLNETNADYFCPKVDTSWTGGMPSSLFVNNATGYHKFFERPLSKQELEKEIQVMLAPAKN